MTDEEYGRAWAAQNDKEPWRIGPPPGTEGCPPHLPCWAWLREGDCDPAAVGEPPRCALPPAVFALIGRNRHPGVRICGTEADAYADLGAAVRAVLEAVPPVRVPS